MAILATVVEQGSMRRAARELGLTPSAVSQQIRQLERETGVTLLGRSTRRLALTDAGQVFHEGCVAMLAAARSAHERLAGVRDVVAGELSISCPVGFAASHLTRAIAPLLTAHPELSLRLLATDDAVDIVRERIDLAITIGTAPPAATLVRRHLAEWPLLLVASPAYLDAHGTPKTGDDLARHVVLALPTGHHPADVLTAPDGRRLRVTMRRRVTSNNQLTIKQLTLAGHGLSFHVAPEIDEELATGALVRVLPRWSLPILSVDALMPPRTAQPAKARVAVEALKVYLTGTDGRRTSVSERSKKRTPAV